MLVIENFSKEILEEHIFKNLLEFGKIYTTNLLDSIKQLGFSFATSSGISIGIDDLKTHRLKNQTLDFLKNFEIKATENTLSYYILQKIAKISHEMHAAIRTAVKTVYNEYDPLNNLHLMSSSGARGSFTQVCQLVGLRGNMSDAHGNKIAIPVEANFREGLTVLEYFISAFGARKGVIDTALGTASSGYLTRRLIFAMRELIIREVDCGNIRGLVFNEGFLDQEDDINQITSRIDTQFSDKNIIYLADLFTGKKKLPKEISKFFLKNSYLNQIVTIYSSLTCNSLTSICQKCYNQSAAPLGNPIGIIAAQSIGEPATQMTMRTFHTGGIFAGEFQQESSTTLSGQLLHKEVSGSLYQIWVSHLTENFLESNDEIWNSVTTLKIPKNFYLKILRDTFFIEEEFSFLENDEKKNLRFAEFEGVRSKISGKLTFRTTRSSNNKILDKRVEIEPGFQIALPTNICFSASFLKKRKGSLAFLNIVATNTRYYENLSFMDKPGLEVNTFKGLGSTRKNFEKNLKKTSLIFVDKGQYLDKNTVLSRVYLYSKRKNLTGKFENFSKNNIFLVPFVNNFFQESIDGNLKKIKHITSCYQISPNSKVLSSANRNKIAHCSYTLIDIFKTPRDAIFLKNVFNNTFVDSGQIFAKIKAEKIRGADIVQGLPKINRIIEANLYQGCLTVTKFSGLIFFRSNSKKDLHLIGPFFSPKNEYLINIFGKDIFSCNTNFDDCKILKTEILSFTKTGKLFLQGNPTHKFLDSNLLLKPYINFYKKGRENKIRFMQICASRTPENINIHKLCEVLAKHFQYRLSAHKGSYFCIYKIRLIIVQSLIDLYENQGITLHSRHFEILVKHLTEKVLIINGGETPFLPMEKISLNLASEFFNQKFNSFCFRPVISSAKNAAISSKSFLSNIAFQEIKKGLLSAIMVSNEDWINGLKESLIFGRDLPIGNNSALKKKNLDNFLLYKYRRNCPKISL